jgi:hypothetical protein
VAVLVTEAAVFLEHPRTLLTAGNTWPYCHTLSQECVGCCCFTVGENGRL